MVLTVLLKKLRRSYELTISMAVGLRAQYSVCTGQAEKGHTELHEACQNIIIVCTALVLGLSLVLKITAALWEHFGHACFILFLVACFLIFFSISQANTNCGASPIKLSGTL